MPPLPLFSAGTITRSAKNTLGTGENTTSLSSPQTYKASAKSAKGIGQLPYLNEFVKVEIRLARKPGFR